MNRMLFEVCNEFEKTYTETKVPSFKNESNVMVYLGNMHVKPVSRLWNTQTFLDT